MIKNKQLSFIKNLPIGCRLISDDLVKMLNVSFDFAEKLKISTIDLYNDRNPVIEIPVWEEFSNNIKNKIEHNYVKKIITSRLDEIFNLVFKILPDDKNFYSSHAIETVIVIMWRALNEFKLEFILSFCDIFEYLGFQAIVS